MDEQVVVLKALDEWDEVHEIEIKTQRYVVRFEGKDVTVGSMRCDQCKQTAAKLAIMSCDSIYHGASLCKSCLEKALRMIG